MSLVTWADMARVAMRFSRVPFIAGYTCSLALAANNGSSNNAFLPSVALQGSTSEADLPLSVIQMKAELKTFLQTQQIRNARFALGPQADDQSAAVSNFVNTLFSALSNTNAADLASAWDTLSAPERNLIILFALNLNDFLLNDQRLSQLTWLSHCMHSDPVYQAIMTGYVPKNNNRVAFSVFKIVTTSVSLKLHSTLKALWQYKLVSDDEIQRMNTGWLDNARGNNASPLPQPVNELLVDLATTGLSIDDANVVALFEIGQFSYADIDVILQFLKRRQSDAVFHFLQAFAKRISQREHLVPLFEMIDTYGYTKDIIYVCYEIRAFEPIRAVPSAHTTPHIHSAILNEMTPEFVAPKLYWDHVQNLMHFRSYDAAQKFLALYVGCNPETSVDSLFQIMIRNDWIDLFKGREFQSAIGGDAVAVAVLMHMHVIAEQRASYLLRVGASEQDALDGVVYRARMTKIIQLLEEFKSHYPGLLDSAARLAFRNRWLITAPLIQLQLEIPTYPREWPQYLWHELSLGDLLSLMPDASSTTD